MLIDKTSKFEVVHKKRKPSDSMLKIHFRQILDLTLSNICAEKIVKIIITIIITIIINFVKTFYDRAFPVCLENLCIDWKRGF